MAPIMASTVAILSAVKRYGSELGMRTRRKIWICPPPYERISSSADGRTVVRPRSVLTITGKKTRIAAIAIFEVFSSGPNHWFVIGAKAMIGTALAAIASGMTALPSTRQRANTSATPKPRSDPTTKPPTASENV